jgi:two-component system cell cycle response regulator
MAEGQGTTAKVKPQANEMVSLAERMNHLQALRVGFALVVLLSTLLATKVVGASLSDVFFVTAGYIVLEAGIETFRRGSKGRALSLINAGLLLDGIYLAWAMYATGGTQSPLRFLVYLHLVAVSLLAAYRTGIKMALWHSLLFFVVFYAQAAGIITSTETAGGLTPDSPSFTRVSVFNVMAMWLIAIGTAAFSSLNERELRRRRGDLEDLAKMAADLEDAHDPNEVAQKFLDAVGDSFGFKRGVVLAPKGDSMELLAYRGPGESNPPAEGVDSVVTSVWESKETELIAKLDPNDDPRLSALLPFARNLVVVPLHAEHTSIGVLVLEYPESAGTKIERRVVLMVNQFASHAALSLRNAALQQQVKRLADTDGLTGLPNRRTFEAVLEKELSRSSRNGEPVTLMMVDVDHFKKFNDTYGHQTGDEVLQKVGGALAHASRDFDTPARYGGEEFAVILPACSSKESLAVAERLRAAVCQIETVAPVTASAGVATYPTHAGDAAALIKAADEALYESKRAGRDRLTRSRQRTTAKKKAAVEEVVSGRPASEPTA